MAAQRPATAAGTTRVRPEAAGRPAAASSAGLGAASATASSCATVSCEVTDGGEVPQDVPAGRSSSSLCTAANARPPFRDTLPAPTRAASRSWTVMFRSRSGRSATGNPQEPTVAAGSGTTTFNLVTHRVARGGTVNETDEAGSGHRLVSTVPRPRGSRRYAPPTSTVVPDDRV